MIWETIITTPIEIRLMVAGVVTILYSVIIYQAWLINKIRKQKGGEKE